MDTINENDQGEGRLVWSLDINQMDNNLQVALSTDANSIIGLFLW